MRSVPHRLGYLTIWFQVVVGVWSGLGGAALVGKVCHGGQALRLCSPTLLPI